MRVLQLAAKMLSLEGVGISIVCSGDPE